jgi:glycosyltransferase involved in cell wall biosynthesis
MRERELISFVVIAYNDQVNIPRTIETITALDDLGQPEIIVIDDGAHDRLVSTVKKIAATSETVRLIEFRTNYGGEFVRDGGIAGVRREDMATVDADIILPSDRLVPTRAAIEKHSAVGGTTVPDGDVAYIYRKFRLAPRFVGNTTTVTDNIGLYLRKVFELVRFA